ncbi:LOW QUALITY PROTEIN: uncharacterized protein LOC108097888 [Drosophila ficusphila]|uniref:LOW QUALITY PROTEIN: uncharacterized protein LOC108097888 n=1 Tax=Drosophila ficusphila TaxID=30025 RepID=UPI0007E74B3B|nr:LOW QUALITY PROTEIN: uncharacterized protein LOC108097888 [Drosophila ficusphila]
MANNTTKTLFQAIQAEYGLPTASDSSKLSSTGGTPPQTTPRFVIPQLKIPQLQLQPSTDSAAQQKSRQAAEAHNQMLLNEIQLRRRQKSESENKVQSSGFVIPQLGSTPAEPLNIPLLSRLERGVDRLHIRDDGGDGATTRPAAAEAPSPLIDLSSTIIAANKNAPPKESASKSRQQTNQENFEIPFIACDRGRKSIPTGGLLASRRSLHEEEDQPDDQTPANTDFPEHPGPIGQMLDAVVGYPEPRKPQLEYSVSRLERQHLRMCQREDYGVQVKRFRFDTPSPDELVKQALQKSWRVSRT